MSVNQLKFTTFISKTCSCRTHVFKFPCSMLKFLEAVGRWCYILFLVLTMMDVFYIIMSLLPLLVSKLSLKTG